MNRTLNMNQPLPIGESSILSSIQTAGSNLSKTTTIIIGVVLLAIIGAIVYFYFLAPKTNATYKPNSEGGDTGSDDNKSAELLFFYADWCPHCKTAKPIWNDLKTEYQNKTINGYRVVFTDINCSEETAEVDKMMNQYSVEGYPTIKLIKDGQVIEYDAKPSKDTLTQFLNTVL